MLYDSAEGELKGITSWRDHLRSCRIIAVTGLRTAATSAVGTDALARPDAKRVGIFGAAGHENHPQRSCRCKPPRWSIAAIRESETFADEMGPITNQHHTGWETGRRGARRDIILTATNSSVPVFDGNCSNRAHVTTIVGSNVGLVKGGFTRRNVEKSTIPP